MNDGAEVEDVKVAPVACMDDDAIPFGKYRGIAVGLVDQGWLNWFVKQDWCRSSRPEIFWWCVLNRERFDGAALDILDTAASELGDTPIKRVAIAKPRFRAIPEAVSELAEFVDALMAAVVSMGPHELFEAAYRDPKYREALMASGSSPDRFQRSKFDTNWVRLNLVGKCELVQLALLDVANRHHASTIQRRPVSHDRFIQSEVDEGFVPGEVEADWIADRDLGF